MARIISSASTQPIAHGGALADAIARHGGTKAEWLDLSTGISPFALPLPEIDGEVWRRLPDPAIARKAALAAREFYGAGSIPVVTPGSQSVIQLLPRLVPEDRGRQRSAAILSPTYGEYELSFRRADFRVVRTADLEEASEADIVVLANPNNPDGRRFDRRTIVNLAQGRSGRVTVVDEAFADMHPELSAVDRAGEVQGLVVLRSFGKFFGMAGIRLGFAFAEQEIVERLGEWLGPWAVSGPALAVAMHGFAHADLVEQLRRAIAASHAMTLQAIEEAGADCIGETALFALIRHPDAAGLREKLAAHHVLSRAFDHTRDVLRLGLVADRAEAARLASTLRAARQEHGR